MPIGSLCFAFWAEKYRSAQHARFDDFQQKVQKKTKKHTFLTKYNIFEEITLGKKNSKQSKIALKQNSSSVQQGFEQHRKYVGMYSEQKRSKINENEVPLDSNVSDLSRSVPRENVCMCLTR